jgi:hypothetical protein
MMTKYDDAYSVYDIRHEKMIEQHKEYSIMHNICSLCRGNIRFIFLFGEVCLHKGKLFFMRDVIDL